MIEAQSNPAGSSRYIVSADGDLYASNQNKIYRFHHSTILAGKAVAAAGEMQAKQGIISTITNCSGHYMSDPALTKSQITSVLTGNGYTRSFSDTTCTPEQLEKLPGE